MMKAKMSAGMLNVFLAVVISSVSQAQNDSWANNGGGNWQDAANWSAGIAPTKYVLG
jgi:hypothetical protein